MNGVLENQISMCYKVVEFFSNNLSTLKVSAPALEEEVDEFNNELSALDELIITADEDTTGYALQKNYERSNMRDLGLDVAGAVYAHTQRINNYKLGRKVYTTKSTLDKKRDTDILYWCERLLAIAQENAAAIALLGTSAAKLTAYEDSIVAFKDVLQEPADRRGEGHAAFQQADDQMVVIQKRLKTIDAVMQAIRLEHSQLFYHYKANRRIDDNATGHNGGGGDNDGLPEVTELIEANGEESIYEIAYLPSRVFELRNLGNVPLEWGLSDNEQQATFPLKPLAGNASAQFQSDNLAPSGNFVFVRNGSAEDATVELRIIE